MKFAGKVWKLLVGIKDGLSLIFLLLFFFALYALMTARQSAELADVLGEYGEDRDVRAVMLRSAPSANTEKTGRIGSSRCAENDGAASQGSFITAIVSPR